MGACKKIEVDTPDFTVSSNKTTVKAGDSVYFSLKGKVQNVVFYSGEPGKIYEYKDRTSGLGKPQLVFTSYLQNAGELNTLRLLASTDFNGIYDATNAAAATWTDITSRAILSTGTDNTASGTVNLSDFINPENKRLYLAYRYQGYFHATLKQPTWTIRTFNVDNVLADKSSLISSIDNMGWVAVNYKNTTVGWTIASTGQISINGTASGATNTDNEDLIISKALDLKKVVPDQGTPIQYISSTALTNYSYTFAAPGVYRVYFRAFNNSIDEQKEVVRDLTITVTP